MNIPEINIDDPNDVGYRYMIAAHKRAIFDYYDVDADSTSIDQVKHTLISLKSQNPQKYAAIYDEIVRGVNTSTIKQNTESSKTESEIDIIAIKRKIREAYIEYQKEILEKIKSMGVDCIDQISGAADFELTNINKAAEAELTNIKNQLPKLVEEALFKVQKRVIEVKTPTSTAIIDEIVHEKFQTVLDLAANRVNILLVGPAGCGKTHLGFTVAKALNLPFSSQSCSAGVSESVFSGWLLPVGASGKFEYVQSEFVRMYENGGVFLFDEIDAADANVLLFLNQALANGGFTLPQRYEKPFVKKHPDFIAIAAANTYGTGGNITYAGRNLLDGASMDRFRAGVVTMGYSEKIEEQTVDSELLKIGRDLRILFNQKNLKKVLSTRFLQDASKMKKYGWTIKQIFEAYFQDWSKGELDQIKGHLNGILQ